MSNWSVERFKNIVGIQAIDILDELMKNLRDQDYEDLTWGGMDATFLVIASIDMTEEGFIYRDDKGHLLCILGVAKEVEGAIGRSVWMVGTKHLQQMGYVKKLLMTESKKVIENWVSRYGLIYNCVNKDNKKSIRWLTWLGARFLTKQAEIDDEQFISFYIDGRGR